MIEVKNLTKRFGQKAALSGISFSVKKGEVLGFLGPNGAGKSTTMNILTGYLSPTAGTASVDGFDVLNEPNEVKKRIGYLPEIPPLYPEMTVEEYLDFVCDLKKVQKNKSAHIDELCRRTQIAGVRHRLIKNLSRGYRQRVGLSGALAGDPDVLILDEPTVGLDPKQIKEIRGLIQTLGKTHTVILSSHILPEVQAVCDRIVIINGGRIVAEGTTESLSSELSPAPVYHALIKGEAQAIRAELLKLRGVKAVVVESRGQAASLFSLEVEKGADPREGLFDLLSANHWPLLELKSNAMTLEEIFLKLTSENLEQDGRVKANGGEGEV